MQLPEDPSVLVLLVATDGATWLPETLRGLRAQKHRPINVVAVDNASSDGSGDLLVKAFGERRVVTLERRVGYGRALAAGLKIAAERNVEADAFLLIHDDAALAEGAIERMVEALAEDGVGIVGCKLVDWDDPDQLQDIGRTTDRYGRQVPRVERGELDQGQHTGRQEVLYCSSAVMLIGRGVVEEVGLFDGRYVVQRDDLDLCWRARLAGHRTIVETDVTARHARAGERDLRAGASRGRNRYFAERNMIATLIKNYSLLRLAVALPVTMLISLWNVLLFLVTGRRRAALQVLEAMQWNVVHLPSTIRQRVRAQHARRVDDSVIAGMMHHGATRLRAQFERAVEVIVGTPEEVTDEEIDLEPPRLVDRLRAHPVLIATLFGLLLIGIGSRGLWTMGDLAGADLAPFPDRSTELFGEYTSGWRGAARGGAAPASPALAILGVLTFASFGSGWLLQRLMLLGLPIVGGLLVSRLGAAAGLSPLVRRLSGVAYALSPLVLTAYGTGRLSDLVLFAALPGVMISLLRAAGILDAGGWRQTAAGVVGVAITAAFAPWILPAVLAMGIVLAGIARWRRKPVEAIVRRIAITAGGAFVLLLPWSAELLRPGSPIGAGPVDPPVTMTSLLGLTPTPLRPVPLAVSLGLALAAAAGVVVARGPRRLFASVTGVLAFGGLAAAWAVARGVPWIAPRSALPLAVTAVAMVVLAGIALETVGPLLRARQVGVLHVATALIGLLVAAQLAPAVAWFGRGEHPGVVASGDLVPSFFVQEAENEGAFRVLWVGGTRREPAIALTGPSGGSIRGFLARPAGGGARALDDVVASIAGGATETGARQLATFGIRYVIVRPEAAEQLADAFARQGDLAFSQRFGEAAIYRSTVGLPAGTSIASEGWIAAARAGDLEAVALAEAQPGLGPSFVRLSATAYEGEVGPNVAELLLAEDFSANWELRGDGGVVSPPERSFGWATRFRLGHATGTLRVDWRGQRWHRAALLGQGLILIAFAAGWSQRAARDRGER